MVYKRSEIDPKTTEVQLWDAIPTTFINTEHSLSTTEVTLGVNNLFILNNEPNQQDKMIFPAGDRGIFIVKKPKKQSCIDVYDFNDFYGISAQDPDFLVNLKSKLSFSVNQVYGQAHTTKVSLGKLIGNVDPGPNVMLWVIVAGAIILAIGGLVFWLWYRRKQKLQGKEVSYHRIQAESTIAL